MEIVASALDWTSIDEENLAKFLDSETGKRFLPKLLETTPTLLATGDVNAILVRSGEVRGFQQIVRDILSLAHPQSRASDVTPPANDYPPPEDDRHWNDGQKLTPTETVAKE